MADNVYSYDVLEGTPAPNQPVGTWGDFAKMAGSSVLETGEQLAAASQYAFEAGGGEAGADISRGFRKIFGAGKESIDDTVNPETRKLAASAMTSPEFWEHPLLGTALKLTGMTGSMAAMAIPGGLLADAIAITVGVAAAGGAINAGSGLAEFYSRLDKATNEELAEQSPKFKAMLEADPEHPDVVRQQFMHDAAGWGPALNGLIGAATNAAGPAGMLARRVGSGAGSTVLGAGGRGRLGSAGIGAIEGAGTEAIESGTSDVINQQSLVDAELQKHIDYAQTGRATLEGAVLGGIAGGGFGSLHSTKQRAKAIEDVEAGVADTVVTAPPLPGVSGPSAVPGVAATAMPAPTVPAKLPSTVEVAAGGAQVKEGTTGVAGKPVADPELIGDPQNGPTRSRRDYGATARVPGAANSPWLMRLALTPTSRRLQRHPER